MNSRQRALWGLVAQLQADSPVKLTQKKSHTLSLPLVEHTSGPVELVFGLAQHSQHVKKDIPDCFGEWPENVSSHEWFGVFAPL